MYVNFGNRLILPTRENLLYLRYKNVLNCFRRSPISVTAAAIFMASQASKDKKTMKGNLSLFVKLWIKFIHMSGSC